MSTITFGLIIGLVAIALTILAVLGFFIYKPAKELILRSKSNNAISKKVILLQRIDLLMEQDLPLEAISILPSVPYTELPRSAENLAGIRDINQAFLARVLVLSEKIAARIPNIERLEALILERQELYQLLFKARFSYETLLGKRESDGKSLPNWTKNEFTKKETEIYSALSNNLGHLNNEIKHMMSSLKQSSSGEYLIH
jgi:hypothetical protein